MQFRNGDGLNIQLFGISAESRYFLESDFKENYDLIGFNANIVSFYPDAIASFIAQSKRKNYFIDPQLYAFQQPLNTIMKKNNKLEVKSSVLKLAKNYGEYIEEILGKQIILESDLFKTNISSICEKVLEFQVNFLKNRAKEANLDEFIDEIEFQPEFLIIPYLYYLPDDFEKLLDVNIALIENSIKIKNQKYDSFPLFVGLSLHKEVLNNQENVDKLLKRIKNFSEINGIVLWIDDLKEFEAATSLSTLRMFKNLLIELNSLAIPIINLHGSYLSMVFSGQEYKLLCGVGHGIEYGESRPILPVGGGIPSAKFYFPVFHQRIDYDPESIDILTIKGWSNTFEEYFNNVCDCKKCKELMEKAPDVETGFAEYGHIKISEKKDGKKQRSYPDPVSLDYSRRHYLYTKNEEYKFIKKSHKNEILEDLNKSIEISKELEEIDNFKYLVNWKILLEE